MARGLFITGTGTGVGKTYVAALIARQLAAEGRSVGVYKPVASGCRRDGDQIISDDALQLWEAAGRPPTPESVCPQRFLAPLAPHRAAEMEGRTVDCQLLRSGIERWRESCDVVIVEGVGGLMSPVSDSDYSADLAQEFGYPLVVVSANELGTINATLQTLMAAATCGLRIAGVVLNCPHDNPNDPSMLSNQAELERHCKSPILAEVAHRGGFDRPVDWWNLSESREM